ncbi:glycosyltransferase [Salinibacterium sp. M195]|uniref:glycosyltransferase n=1 Tax=Salinibacterium sp. M195 TaxID=2583374 RepID=UPI001C63098A|nr:hypothetical protein [Salinibacterium sp. M195]QYH35614.1 glycosyltransferase [Salinibacterium sp. M195]
MNRTLQALRSRLPDWIGGRLRAKKFRYRASDVPRMSPVPSTPIRVFIGPANYAGQGDRYARAIEALPGIGAVSMQRVIGNFGFPADISVPPNVFRSSRRWQKRQRAYVLANFTHVVYEAQMPLFGDLVNGGLEAEVAELRSHGIHVVMLSHGSDLRSPALHRERDKWSPFHETNPRAERVKAIVEKNRAALGRLNAPVLVTTPDLLGDWPTATWIPLVVEPERWENESPILERSRPRVLHAPSNAWIKGSDLIEPVLTRLHDDGVIEYKRVSGVPGAQMPALYREADIVLEQFRIGTYSVTAVEALAAGRLVIAHVFDDVRAHVEDAVDRELPVIEATVDSVEEVLLAICADRDHFIQQAKKGPAFVRAVHDGRLSAEVLEGFLH